MVTSKNRIKKNNHLKSINISSDWQKINFIVCAMLVVFGIGYLLQVNSLATKGYQIKELEKSVAELKLQKSDLELEALSLQSVGSVKEKIGEMKMVSLGKEDFLAGTAVAVAR